MSATILLEALGIEKRYDKFAALAGVDLKVRANTVHSPQIPPIPWQPNASSASS